MKYCNNKALQILTEKIVQKLDYENRSNERRISYEYNEYDIPFLIAPMVQSFNANESKYFNLIGDLNYYDYDVYVEDMEYSVQVGIVLYEKVIEKPVDHFYKLVFSTEEKLINYCTCETIDEGYRIDKGCCGEKCDWESPKFSIVRCQNINEHSWVGLQKDYWKFEDEFYENKCIESDMKKNNEDEEELKELIKEFIDLKNKLTELGWL